MSETQTTEKPPINRDEVLNLVLSTIPPEHEKDARRKILELLLDFCSVRKCKELWLFEISRG